MAAGKKTTPKAAMQVKAKGKTAQAAKKGEAKKGEVEGKKKGEVPASEPKQEPPTTAEAKPAEAAKPTEGAKAAKAGKAGAKAKAKARTRAKASKIQATRLQDAQAQVEAEENKVDEAGEGKAKGAKKEKEPKAPRGLIYIGSIPKGFFEPQMKRYFSQFGDVTNLRHSRSKKTANSKGYGWVEFKDPEVAKIAADTMNGYLLFGSRLKCHVVPEDKRHPKLFKPGMTKKNMRNFIAFRRAQSRSNNNDRPTVMINGEAIPRQTTGEVKKARRRKQDDKLRKMFSEMGVDFDFSGADAEPVVPAPSSPKSLLMKAKLAKAKAVPTSPALGAASSPKVAAAKDPKVEEAAGKKRAAAGQGGKSAKKAKPAKA